MLALISNNAALHTDTTDMLWILICAGLVFIMQPGFMCLESGLTRSKNSINVAVKNLADFGISVALFWAVGYGVMFGKDVAGIVGANQFLMNIDERPELVAFFVFQVMFCSTATTIVSGAVAERLRFGAYLAIALLVSGLIYPIFGHWAWNGLNSSQANGWLAQLGFIDFAGSTVVHSAGAWVSLAILVIIGARQGRFPETGPPQKIQGSNLPMAMLGGMLLWFGWIGFNGGSTLDFNDQVAGIILNTIVSGVAGMLIAGLLSLIVYKHTEVEALLNGSIAGLVAITASCHAVSTPIAFVIGAIGGVVMVLVSRILERWRIDDAVDAIAVHGGAGAWGTLAVGLFGRMDLLGSDLNRFQLIWVQILGIVVCFAWAFGVSWLVLSGCDRFSPLRVSAEAEEIGLNVSEHRAKTELYDLFQVMDEQTATQNLALRVPVQPFTEVGHIARRYNQVIDALERKTQDLLNYLDQVTVVTAAAAAVETDTFQPGMLATVAPRTDELGQLARVFQQMFSQIKIREQHLQDAKNELAIANHQLEQRVAERTQELAAANAAISALNQQLQAENLRMSAELEVTRRLQRMILPTDSELKAISELDIAGFMEPATEVGGDYYDVLNQGDRIMMSIGDVTGHGLESGVLMIMAQTAVRALSTLDDYDSHRLLKALNQVVYQNAQRMGSSRHLTLSLLSYHEGKLLVTGQHEEVIVVRQGGTVERVDTIDLGFPVGMVEDIDAFINQQRITLNIGDGVVLYTDGITEAENRDRTFYGLDRLVAVIQNHWHLTAGEIRATIIQDLRSHIDNHIVYDDITLVVVKRVM
jgi:ammonium transporter